MEVQLWKTIITIQISWSLALRRFHRPNLYSQLSSCFNVFPINADVRIHWSINECNWAIRIYHLPELEIVFHLFVDGEKLYSRSVIQTCSLVVNHKWLFPMCTRLFRENIFQTRRNVSRDFLFMNFIGGINFDGKLLVFLQKFSFSFIHRHLKANIGFPHWRTQHSAIYFLYFDPKSIYHNKRKMLLPPLRLSSMENRILHIKSIILSSLVQDCVIWIKNYDTINVLCVSGRINMIRHVGCA